MKRVILSVILCSAVFICIGQPADVHQQSASIGDFQLESGKTINDCSIGYRVFGKLNPAKNNAILFLTWFGGNSRNVADMSPWQAIDTTRYCLIIIDALGDGVSSSNIPLANMLWELFLTTPTNRVENTPPSGFADWLKFAQTKPTGDYNDIFYQITAVIGHDISKPFNGSMQEAAAHVKARMLIISSQQDHMVNPAPAIEFSKLVPAKLVLIDSDLGHLISDFGDKRIKDSIVALLDAK